MQRSTVLFLLLAGAVVAVVAAIAFSGPGEVVLPPGTGGGPGAKASDANSNQNGSAGSAPSETGLRAPHEGSVPPDAPHVTITVTSMERFVPPPNPPPLATTAAGEALSAQILAGVGAGFDAPSNDRGVAMISVDVPPGRLLRQVAWNPKAPNPARIGPRIVVRGTVFDAEKIPVQAAFVWFGELAADGTAREFGVDEEGAFEADVPAGQGVPMVVRAKGFASKWRTIEVTSDMRALTEMLQPAATVQIQLATRAIEIDKARAFVVTRAQVSSGVSQWPFFRQCLSGGYAINEDGQVRIDDLPQVGTVGVVIRHPLAPLVAPAEIRLSPKPVRATVPARMVETRMHSVVTDDDGNGIALASVWALRERQRLDSARSLRLLPPHLNVLGACYSQTDANGRFLIGSVDDAEATLTVRAHGYAGRNVPSALAKETVIVLPKWRGGDAALRILPPVAGKVWRVSINLGDGIDETCAADDAFVIALPHVGSFDIKMVLRIDGKQRGSHDVKRLMVTGPLELATPSPN